VLTGGGPAEKTKRDKGLTRKIACGQSSELGARRSNQVVVGQCLEVGGEVMADGMDKEGAYVLVRSLVCIFAGAPKRDSRWQALGRGGEAP